MRDRPDGAELLDLSARVLRETLLPLLPGEQKHSLLMIANAMAIAARQLRAGDAPLRQERAGLRALLGRPTDGDDGADALAQQLRELNAELCQKIRLADETELKAIHAVLLEVARQRVRESNPAYIDSAGRG